MVARIIHDHLIIDSNNVYWSLSDKGWLMCIGSEIDVPIDAENGYWGVKNIQEAYDALVADGYIERRKNHAKPVSSSES